MQSYIKGQFSHRRTEDSYMGALLDGVTLDDWRDIVGATVASAKAGDPSARAWLAQYLIGKSGITAPAPLTVVVQRLSGEDPLATKLSYPIVARMRYGTDEDDGLNDKVRAGITNELKALEANSLASSKTGETAGDKAASVQSSAS
jgi:hypothetical protein